VLATLSEMVVLGVQNDFAGCVEYLAGTLILTRIVFSPATFS
jgi:hypothetical protein